MQRVDVTVIEVKCVKKVGCRPYITRLFSPQKLRCVEYNCLYLNSARRTRQRDCACPAAPAASCVEQVGVDAHVLPFLHPLSRPSRMLMNAVLFAARASFLMYWINLRAITCLQRILYPGVCSDAL